VQSGGYLWSQTFDARFRDIFDVHDEIARTVAAALEVRIAPAAGSATTSPSPNVVAYELYLRGLFHWNRRTIRDVRLAIDFFTQAAQHDTTFARPYAGLALSYAVLPLIDPTAGHVLPLTHDMAARALALDSTLAEAHAARGYAFHWQWRWAEAETELQRAIALNASYSTAHQWYGEHLVKMGRGREAEAEMRRAIQLDPHAVVAQNDLAIILYLDRRFDQAIAQLELVRRVDPAFAITLLLLHRVHLATGNVEAAADAGRRWAELTGTLDPAELVVLSMAVRDTTRRAAAREILAGRERGPAPQWPDIAMYYALIDDRAGAVRALERALAARSPMLTNVGVVSWLDPLRDDPAVRRIITALQLPAPTDH
jgi:tetratricopeptide (TPR) repeat protein